MRQALHEQGGVGVSIPREGLLQLVTDDITVIISAGMALEDAFAASAAPPSLPERTWEGMSRARIRRSATTSVPSPDAPIA